MIEQDITVEEYIIRELSKHCGETGANEDAAQTLHRIIEESAQLKAKIKSLRDLMHQKRNLFEAQPSYNCRKIRIDFCN